MDRKSKSPHRRGPTILLAGGTLCFLTGLALFFLVAGCSTYGERVAPVPLPESRPEHVELAGVSVAGRAYEDADEAKAAFGFAVRKAGLLPVQLVVDNQSDAPAMIVPEQTFLVDRQGQAWPLLTAQQAYERAKSQVEIGETFMGAGKPAVLLGAAGALAGFAVGVISGDNVGEAAGKGAILGSTAGALAGGASTYNRLGSEVRQDLAAKSLRNEEIRPKELAYGFLFFPGKDEAETVYELRLAMRIGGERHLVHLPLLVRERE